MARIVDLPEKIDIGNTDYLLIDNPEIGTRKIGASVFSVKNSSGGAALAPWRAIAATTNYQAQVGDRLVCFAGAGLITAPVNPAIGDDFTLCGYDCSQASDRKIDGFTKMAGETVLGARVVDRFSSARLIYLGDDLGWMSDRLSAVAPRYNSINLNFASNGDTNGLFYFLGTNALGESFTNPSTRGFVQLTASSILSGNAAAVLCDRQTSAFYSNNAAGSWVKVNILANYRLRPTYYSWRTRSDSNGNHLRNWRLRGSLDDSIWEDLDVRTNDTTLNGTNAWGGFAVANATKAYKFFQLLITGNDSSSNLYLTGGEWELYGELYPV